LESSLGSTEALQIEVERADGQRLSRQLPVTEQQMLKSDGDAVANLGFRTWWPDVKPIVGDLVEGGAADQAGLQIDDLILSVDAQTIDSWRELVSKVQPSAGKALALEIERDHGNAKPGIGKSIAGDGQASTGRCLCRST